MSDSPRQPEATGRLLAGAARVDITPPLSVPFKNLRGLKSKKVDVRELRGFVGRSAPPRSVHDPICARAVAVGDRTNTAVIVSIDIDEVGLDFCDEIRAELAARRAHPPDLLMMAATHNHSGQEIYAHETDAERELYKELKNQILAAVENALGTMRPAKCGWGEGSLGEPLVNRREPGGAVDPSVGVVRFDDAVSGDPIAVIINYACHVNVLGAANLDVTSDFPGYACRLVEGALDDSCVCAFLNGAAGNINPAVWPYGPDRDVDAMERLARERGEEPTFRASHAAARRIGNLVGAEAVRIAETIICAPDATLRLDARMIALPLKVGDELARFLELMGPEEGELLRRFESGQSTESPVQAIRIGDGALLALPGEPFVEIGLAVKRAFSDTCVLVVGYSNDMVGYIPTAEVADDQSRYENVNTPLAGEAARVLTAKSIALLEEVLT